MEQIYLQAMPEIFLPPVIKKALEMGAALIISTSGGKDSQAMIVALVIAYVRNKWTGPIYALHMDLGRAEWPESYNHCMKIAATAGIELVIIRRPQGDLYQEIEDRMHKTAGLKPFWPSANNRYCTGDQKRDQADKELIRAKPFWPSSDARYCTGHHKTNQADKELRKFNLVISAEGIRAQESSKRERKSPVAIRQDVTSKALEKLSPEDALEMRSFKQRLVLTWYPIFFWTEEQVYERCGHTIEERNYRRLLYAAGRKEESLDGWEMSPVYVYGNDRHSCKFCILASLNDLQTGAREHPEDLNYLISLEDRGGYTFKHKWSLKELLNA